MRPSVLAAAPGGLGVPAAVALLIPMEAGVPVPIPADVLILFLGERAAAGSLPLWLAVLCIELVAVVGTAALFLVSRGPGRAVVSRLGPRVGFTPERVERATALIRRRGAPALAVGRGTPGLRTITVIAAGGSGLPFRRALPGLVLGSSVFLQLHLFLGLLLGPPARDAIDRATAPALAGLAVLALGAAVFWLVRRGRRSGAQAWTEAACPACLALGALGERTAKRVR